MKVQDLRPLLGNFNQNTQLVQIQMLSYHPGLEPLHREVPNVKGLCYMSTMLGITSNSQKRRKPIDQMPALR